jgi:hypothetical protein
MSRQDELDGVFAAVERRDSEFIADWLERHAHPDVEFTSVTGNWSSERSATTW